MLFKCLSATLVARLGLAPGATLLRPGIGTSARIVDAKVVPHIFRYARNSRAFPQDEITKSRKKYMQIR